jgi:hypothetical protein
MLIIPYLSSFHRGVINGITLAYSSVMIAWLVVFVLPDYIKRRVNRGRNLDHLHRHHGRLSRSYRLLHREAGPIMTLLDLIGGLETTPVTDVCRDVKVVIVNEEGEAMYSLAIDRIASVQEWTVTEDGRRQYQYKVALVTEPLTV